MASGYLESVPPYGVLAPTEKTRGFFARKERFATRVHRDGTNRQIDVNLLSGPFRKLTNRWRFLEDPAGTRIEFDIDFQFKSRLLEGLLAANFHHAVERLMSCFEDRARVLYGAT